MDENPKYILASSSKNWYLVIISLISSVVLGSGITQELNDDPGFIIKLLTLGSIASLFLILSVFLSYRLTAKIKLFEQGISFSNILRKKHLLWKDIQFIEMLFTGKPRGNYSPGIFFRGLISKLSHLGSLRASITAVDNNAILNFNNIDPNHIEEMGEMINNKIGVIGQKEMIKTKPYLKYRIRWDLD